MNNNSNSQTKSDDLKYSIKSILKSEFEHEVFSLCSEEERKSISTHSEAYSEKLVNEIIDKIENPKRDKKLEILYNHEKQVLDILKDYKEEIKFAASLQAEIRKEEATFFSSTLKDVCSSLKETQVEPKYQVQWIFDLVNSYTSSLKVSSKLAEEHAISLIGDIQQDISKTIKEE